VIRRLTSALLLVWLIGFVLFVGLLPRPAGAEVSDGIIVLTGGPGRIERGLELLEQRKARKLLVSGVDLTVRPPEFAAQYKVPPRLFACCVELGQEAVDTRSNGAESADWVKRHGYRSVRLVTTDWHMRRARLELDQALPANIVIRPDAVRSEPNLSVLLKEYHKYLLRRAAILFGY
jgi:uncharacterized SAM-binding protein YcdF (DUF218 family)